MISRGYLVDARLKGNKIQLLIGVPNKGGWYNHILDHTEHLKAVLRGLDLPYTEFPTIDLMNIQSVLSKNPIVVFTVFKKDTYKRAGIKFKGFDPIENYPLERGAVTWDKKELPKELTPEMATNVFKMFHLEELLENAKSYTKKELIPYLSLPIKPLLTSKELVFALESLYKNGQAYCDRSLVIKLLNPPTALLKKIDDAMQSAREINGIEVDLMEKVGNL